MDRICRNCKHWTYNNVACGRCDLITLAHGHRPVDGDGNGEAHKAFWSSGASDMRHLYTAMDFGCVKWEKKPEGPFIVQRFCEFDESRGFIVRSKNHSFYVAGDPLHFNSLEQAESSAKLMNMWWQYRKT